MVRGAILALVLAVLATACGGSSGAATFSDPGASFTFSYPKQFASDFARVKREVQGRPPQFSTNVGVNPDNVIVASQYGLKKPYTDYTPADFQASIDTLVRTIARADGSRVTTIGRGKLGPLDAYTYALEGPGGSTSRIMIGFKDRTEYYVDCTSQPVQAKTISSACDQVTKTFAVH